MPDVENLNVVELNFNFLGRKIRLRCPKENHEKLTRCADIIQQNLLTTKKNQPKVSDIQLVLMTCLQLAFKQQVQVEEIKSVIDELITLKSSILMHKNKEDQSNNVATSQFPVNQNETDSEGSFEKCFQYPSDKIFDDQSKPISPSTGEEYGTLFKTNSSKSRKRF